MRTFASAVVGSLFLLSVASAAEPATQPTSPLDQVVPEIRFDAATLSDVIASVSQRTLLKIDVEWEELAKGGVTKSTPVTVRVRNVRASRLLQVILNAANDQGRARFRSDFATYAVMPDDRIVVSTLRSQVARTGETKDYAIGDFVEAARLQTEKQRDEVRKSIVELIKDTYLAEMLPSAPGEVSGTIALSGNTITIFTHAEGHRKIQDLLHKMRASMQPATQPR